MGIERARESASGWRDSPYSLPTLPFIEAGDLAKAATKTLLLGKQTVTCG